MKLKIGKIIFPVFLITLLGFLYMLNFSTGEDEYLKINKIRSTASPKAEKQSVKDRDEYFFKMLRDPKTNSIPADVLKNERKFSERIKNRGLRKSASAGLVNFTEAGPKDVGGRTRALAVDVRNADIVLAGGVSGGIWKSTNRGSSWQMKFTTSQVLSVSSIVQDTRPGNEDTWYAATGEVRGNSASETGAFFAGAGIYKSTDNGETWNLLPKNGDDVTFWDHPLDYVSKISINLQTGSLFIASNGYGILRSDDGGISGNTVLGGSNRYCEVDIESNGTIVAALSENSSNSSLPSKVGVWKSTDNGVNWTDITPSSYPAGAGYNRAVVDIAPSNNDICYVLLEVNDAAQDNRLYKINLASNTSEDLSANLPDYNGQGIYASQGSYNMMIAVKPDDENVVLIGGTNLYRSLDGFATPLDNDKNNQWIGGYAHDGNGSFANSHPDIHSFAFDVNHPDTVWVGHDGGLSYTNNILWKQLFTTTPWEKKNNGYNVTQVYHISIPGASGDNRIMVGCQDNGTPFFKYDGSTISSSYDVSSGDGSFSHFGKTRAYVSTQNGSILQLGYDGSGNVDRVWDGISPNEFYAFVHPDTATYGAKGQLFINPFVVDPLDEDIMYYPAGKSVFRSNDLSSVTRGSGSWDGRTTNWTKLTNLDAPQGYTYTAINVSNQNSSHVLYYAAYSGNAAPKIYRLDNANVSTNAAVDISIAGITQGAYINNIAINPLNSDEILVVATNYNIVGLYYSADGGTSYTAVEGNLQDGPVPGDLKGPSLRAAKILPVDNGTIYLVGTSVGLFSTGSLNGSVTVWEQEGADVIGNVVVTSIAARTNDNYVAVGTHGRGVFTGTANSAVGIKQLEELPTSYSLSQNYPNPFNPATKIRYSVPLASNVSLKIFNTNGEEVAEVVNQYQGAGTFEVDWNGTNSRGAKVASGAYFYTLRAGDFVQSKKMLLLK